MHRIHVPATLANLGSGYDTLGLAIDVVNTFTIREGRTSEHDLVHHTATAAAKRFGGEVPPFRVEQIEEIPRARGMGSSATARVAGLLAWKALTGRDLDEASALAFLAEAEGHPDNVWPAWLGGLVVCGPVARRLDPVATLQIAVASPSFEVSTQAARAVLPKTVPHADAVANVQAIGLLLAGLLTGDAEALRHGVRDRLHQPARAPLLGPVDAAFEAAAALGAAPFVSGSGSTLAAFVLDGRGEAVARALAAPYRAQGTTVAARVVHVRTAGATIEEGVG